MYNIAIIPWNNVYMNDELFNLGNDLLNRDNGLQTWCQLKEYLYRNGCVVHTIDAYTDLDQVDLFVFFYFDTFWYRLIYQTGKVRKTVYIAFEPPVVDLNHSRNGLRFLSRYFGRILTWDDDVVDGNVFLKFMFPYILEDSPALPTEEEFRCKKLICNISSDKQSHENNELYSERRRVIQYYDRKGGFDLYGIGWKHEEHVSYRGECERKKDVYKNYRFALCLENMHGIRGYVTEKALDCFCNGIVPIYLGALNCDDYFPGDCYVHYDDFKTPKELDAYLCRIEYEEYVGYLKRASKWINQNKESSVFMPQALGAILVDIIKTDGYLGVSKGNMILYRSRQTINNIRMRIKKMVRHIKGDN